MRLALPLGLGKPNFIVNALVERAIDGRLDDLTIYTALTLAKPPSQGDLLDRLMRPIAERCFGDYPDPDYVALRARQKLPENITLHEFYYPPGSMLGNARAQQDYISINFTQALRMIWRADFNVIAQLVGHTDQGYDLAGNPDLAADLLDQIHARRQATGDDQPIIVAQTNHRLPTFGHDAFVAAERIDFILEGPDFEHELFGKPSLPPTDAEYIIGARAASLLADGGSIQIGIGNIGDAVAWAALLRNEKPEAFTRLLDALGDARDGAKLCHEVGGTERFTLGLYGSSEMLPEGLLRMYERGLLRRAVFDDLALQQAVNRHGPQPSLTLLDALIEAGRVHPQITESELEFLHRHGILQPSVDLEDGELLIEDNPHQPDLLNEQTRASLDSGGLGEELRGGVILHAGFFLGSQGFYETLRSLDDEQRESMRMVPVSFTNRLLGQEELKRAQRQKARFVNEAMKVTLSGAIVSDGLGDNRVVSGVGGQYEFVAMAHELDQARSILVLVSTRESKGELSSNIVFNYGHTTVPRHLRDIVITEYGIADLRYKSDAEIAQSLICIADSRFQEQLLEQAKEAGKIPKSWQIPQPARQNTPEHLAQVAARFRDEDIIPRLPFGTELTEQELDLVEALQSIGEATDRLSVGKVPEIELDLEDAIAVLDPPPAAQPYLERMGLEDPEGVKELAMQRLIVLALSSADKI